MLTWHDMLCIFIQNHSHFLQILSHNLESNMMKTINNQGNRFVLVIKANSITEYCLTHEATRQQWGRITSLAIARNSPLLHHQHNSKKYNNEQQDASNDSSDFNCMVCLFLRFWDRFWSGSS